MANRVKYIVCGNDLNFDLRGTRCVSGSVVDLDPTDYVVGCHIREGSIRLYVPEVIRKPTKE